MKILLNVIIIAITGLCTFLGFGLTAVTILFGFAALFMGSPLLGLFFLWVGLGLFNFTSDQISDIELL
jgi:hypothetical protein